MSKEILTEDSRQKTRQLISDAACELFAEHGIDGVSTRMIAEKAGIALGGIHYHFKNKEALYLEVLRRALDSGNALTIDDLLAENSHLLETVEGKQEAIRRIVEDFYRRCFDGRKDWRKKVMLRELWQSSPSPFLEKNILKDWDRNIRFFKMLSPEGSDEDAFIWSYLPDALAAFQSLGKDLLERRFGQEYCERLRKRLVRQTVRMMIALLDLPMPDDLK